jgi:hypothetical protein
MTRYLLSVYQPDGPPPPSVDLAKVRHDLDTLNEEMRAAGAWVFSGGLHQASTATVVRVRDGDVLMIDGPYAEGKEHLGGFTIIEASDLDAALDWARKLALAIGLLPIEVRPFHDDADH